MKKYLALLTAILMLVAAVACAGSNANAGVSGPADDDRPRTGLAAVDYIGEDGIDWNHLSMDELLEMARKEFADNPNSVINVYATTSDANTAINKLVKDYPDFKGHIKYISQDTNMVRDKIETEHDTNNVNADVLMVKDAAGEIYNELVLYDVVDVYYPAKVVEQINDQNLLDYGMPLYATFNPWFYNTKIYPDGCPIESWWDIVEGYNPETKSYKDAAGNNTQKWTIYTKDITSPSYAALWAQLIVDGDTLAEQYKTQYGKDLEYTYELQNSDFMTLPENNAGVELFWRFAKLFTVESPDGDAVVEAVNNSGDEGTEFYGKPTLGLCSASKLSNRKSGMDIAWVTGLKPYTAQNAASYSYVVNGCDNPAGARFYILYMMGGEDGQSGCYTTFDKLGHWSVRNDVTYTESGMEYGDVGLTAPNYEQIYANYPNVQNYWKLWSTQR